jgi:hypothetical protein
MVHSDLKNTIDLIKNINELQLNFNNQNLIFKQFIRNSKYVTFTNQSGVDVNLSIEDINNKYKKKYSIDSENSIDTSIFNSNKNLKGGNKLSDMSATSNSFMSKLNNKSNLSLTSEDYDNKNLNGGNFTDDMSATSNSFMSKLNNNNFNTSLTSDSDNNLNEISATSNSFMSKINNNLNDSLTSSTMYGGSINESNLSLEEASVFEDTVSQKGGYSKNNISNFDNSEVNSIFEGSLSQKGGYEEDIKSIISINLDNLKLNKSDKDSVNYSNSNSTLNSISDISKMNSDISDSKILNKILKQNGGGSNLVSTGFRTYNINSSSTSSICE